MDRDPIMQFFRFDHLPVEKQGTSRPFAELAEHVHATLPRNPERTMALRKLLEAKDAAVRAGFMVLMAALFFAGPAFAQDIPAPPSAPVVEAPSVFGEMVKRFVTPEGVASIVVTVLGLVGGALGLTALRKRQVAIVTQHAFHAVEDFSATTETTVDDKIAVGLKVANDWMVAQGWRPLKPGETEVVKLGFTALNGATKVAEKVAANAQVEATKALTSPAVRAELNDLARGVPPSP